MHAIVLVMEPRVSCLLGKHATNRAASYPQGYGFSIRGRQRHICKEVKLWSHSARVQVPPQTLSISVTLGKLLNLSVLRFKHLPTG